MIEKIPIYFPIAYITNITTEKTTAMHISKKTLCYI